MSGQIALNAKKIFFLLKRHSLLFFLSLQRGKQPTTSSKNKLFYSRNIFHPPERREKKRDTLESRPTKRDEPESGRTSSRFPRRIEQIRNPLASDGYKYLVEKSDGAPFPRVSNSQCSWRGEEEERGERRRKREQREPARTAVFPAVC